MGELPGDGIETLCEPPEPDSGVGNSELEPDEFEDTDAERRR